MMLVDRICTTCKHHLDDGMQCSYWEYCTPEGTCHEWKEGSSNSALLWRIRMLEAKL